MVPSIQVDGVLEQQLEAFAQALLVQAALHPVAEQLAIASPLVLPPHLGDLIGSHLIQPPAGCCLQCQAQPID